MCTRPSVPEKSSFTPGLTTGTVQSALKSGIQRIADRSDFSAGWGGSLEQAPDPPPHTLSSLKTQPKKQLLGFTKGAD